MFIRRCVVVVGLLSNDFIARRQLSPVVSRVADVLLNNVCMSYLFDISRSESRSIHSAAKKYPLKIFVIF